MEMCPKDVVDICIPRRDDDNMLMSSHQQPRPTYNNWRKKHPTKNEKRKTNFM